MFKVTLKQIKNMKGEDITYYTNKQIEEIKKKEGWFNEIAWSCGIYGTTGLYLEGNKTKNKYKITSRTSAIYLI